MEPTLAARHSRSLAYRGLLERTLSVLADGDVPVMLLKGTYLAFAVYPSPEDRLEGDLDLLVPESSYGRAAELLLRGGFASSPVRDDRERTFLLDPLPIEVDLHRRLFPRNRFHLPTADLFGRARTESALFSRPVWLPDPYDAYAHLIGHFATSHEPGKASRLRRDLGELEKRHSLSPATCALRLERAGLSRAARYAYGTMDAVHPFGREVLDRLRPDRAGRALADRACRLTRSLPPEHLGARLGGHLVDRSLPHGGFAIGVALVSRAMLYLGRSRS